MRLWLHISSRGKLEEYASPYVIAVSYGNGNYAFINTRGLARGKKNVIVGA